MQSSDYVGHYFWISEKGNKQELTKSEYIVDVDELGTNSSTGGIYGFTLEATNPDTKKLGTLIFLISDEKPNLQVSHTMIFIEKS